MNRGGNVLLGLGVVFVLYLVYKSVSASQPKPVSSFSTPKPISSFLGALGVPPTVPFGYSGPATSGPVPGGAIGSDGSVFVSGVCQYNSTLCNVQMVPTVSNQGGTANDPFTDCLMNPNLCPA